MKGLEMFLQTFDAPASFLLDDYPNAAAAYSLRYLRSAYVGSPVIRVRRSSDNAEQDFTPTEITDGTLTTFTGANDGFVTTWYDQTGNADVVQATAGSQPQIVSVGILLINNSKPTITFNLDSMFTTFFFTPNILDGFQVFSVYQHISQKGGPFNVDSAYTISNGNAPNRNRGMGFTIFGAANNPINYEIQTQGNNSLITTAFTGGQKLISSLHRSGNNNFYLNNSLMGSNTNILSNFTNTPFRICFGQVEWSSQVSSNTNLQEFVVYNSDQTANRTAIETNINSHYNIY